MKHHQIIGQVQAVLTSMSGVDGAVLFGSIARGEATPNSDIDLALVVNERFDRAELIERLKGMELRPDHVLPVTMRNKVVVWFHDMRIKLELPIHTDLSSFGRDLTGSAIPDVRLGGAILLDRSGTLLHRLGQLRGHGYRPNTIDELVQKFIYEFDNLSTFHRRSDGYRALYFHQIALHCLVQLMNMRVNEDRFQFLPRNLLVNITDEGLRQRLYGLNGSMYLPDMNRKKRALLDTLYTTLSELGHTERDEVRNMLESIYERDRYWNLRAVNTHSPLIQWRKLIRSSLPALLDSKELIGLLEEYEIQTVIDLRAPRELEEYPYSSEALTKVRYVHAPLDPWAQPDWFLASEYQQGSQQEVAYRFFALGCRASIRQIVEALVRVPVGQGAIIHCHAGKDRTGIVCAMLQLLVGSTPEDIMADYLASESDTYARNLHIVLDIIAHEGGIRPYLLNCDLSDTVINELENRLRYV